jgi:hypothetical protein
MFLRGPLYNPLDVDNWQANFQSTYIWQKKAAMAAAYTGPHSLTTEAETGYTLTATLSLGFRPWTKAEVFFNPEIIQSAELSNLHGLGGLSNLRGTVLQRNVFHARWSVHRKSRLQERPRPREDLRCETARRAVTWHDQQLVGLQRSEPRHGRRSQP